MRVAPQVQLSPEERAQLLALARHGARSERALRARIVLLAAEGSQNRAIAHTLGVSRPTVGRWRARFLRSRLPGLSDQPRPALSAPGVPDTTVRRIVSATLYGAGRAGYSTRRLAAEFGVSHMTVRRIWRAYRLRPARFRSVPMRPDPILRRAARDVIGLFLRPPDGAMIFTIGPGSDPPVWSGESGFPATAQADPTGQRSGAVRELASGRSATDFPRFLGALDQRIDGETSVRILATGPHLVEPHFLRRWQTRRPGAEIRLVADWKGWNAAVRDELAGADGAARRRRHPKSRGEAARSIGFFVRDYPPEGGAYEWLASAAEIGRGSAAYRLRHDLAVTGHPGFKTPGASSPTVAPKRTPEPAVRAMARNILQNYLRVARKERVTIESWSATLEEANALSLEALRLGARPLLLYQDEPTYWAATEEVAPEDLAQLGEHRRAALERTDAFVSFFGPSDRERFHALPAAALEKLGNYQDALYRAAAKAGARAVQMAVGRASPESARMYGVDLAEWRNELVEGCLVDPKRLRRRARGVADRLARGREILIQHPNGTDLRLGLRRRRPVVSDGTVEAASRKGGWNLVTLPTGVVAVALDERTADGVFRSNATSSIGLSDTVGELAGGRWTFRGGRLTRSSYDAGSKLFVESYARAPVGKDRPASLSVGLNPAISAAPLLEDQGEGTLTMHIGRNDYLGGSTRAYWWAWLFLRGADLTIDGGPLLRRGRWVD